MKLYGLVEDDRGEISDGTSLLSEHNTRFYESNDDQAIEVRTIDFSDYLKTKLHYDEIIVKMNIEGSEYDVKEKLIANDQIKYLKYLFMGFHAQFMTGDDKAVYEEREFKIKKYLNRRNKMYIWH